MRFTAAQDDIYEHDLLTQHGLFRLVVHVLTRIVLVKLANGRHVFVVSS